MSLNLTAADITRPGFAALFLARIDESGFPRGRLTVEITETGLIEDLAAASALLAELRGAGCRVAIKDFETGYSSLAYLKSLPLDYVKIVEDQSCSPSDHRFTMRQTWRQDIHQTGQAAGSVTRPAHQRMDRHVLGRSHSS